MITIATVVVAAIAVLLLPRSVRIVQQGLVGVVKRLGQFHSIRPSGVTFLIPFVDNMTTIDVRETPRTGDRQEVITKDNVSVAVNATTWTGAIASYPTRSRRGSRSPAQLGPAARDLRARTCRADWPRTRDSCWRCRDQSGGRPAVVRP